MLPRGNRGEPDDDIVVEADEYDRSFLALNPTIAIITNLEMEHTDCYANIEELESAFLQFCIEHMHICINIFRVRLENLFHFSISYTI